MDQRKLQEKLNKPYSTENWKDVVQFVFPNVQLFDPPQTIPTNDEDVETFKQLGNVRLNDSKTLALFELHLKDNVNVIRNRVRLNELVSKHINESSVHGVLSIFEKGTDDYRFSFSSKSTNYDEEEGDFKTQKTDSKRFTYVLGKNESCKTPAQRFYELAQRSQSATIDNIQEAFSVEKLSKDFFKEYNDYYKTFSSYLLSNTSLFNAVFKMDEKAVRDFVKLMLGRLVFLHFVQKKRWLGVPTEEEGWHGGDPRFLYNAFKNHPSRSQFYSEFLEPLFYQTLNEPKRLNDIFEVTGTKVPYLNGGLFEKSKLDTSLVMFPEQYFADLFEFFDKYNFTIDENDPNEHEVGIDPEMLGHIFENQLEDNKDKGAFYTPKEIVHYMCQESLSEYLCTYLEEYDLVPINEDEQKIQKDNIRAFVNHKEASKIIEYDEVLATALRDVKICDPAIGSGAFPMGLLTEIFQCVQVLYFASRDTVGEVWGMEDWEAHTVKKNIIQNSIYGVDIEKGAVDIARLRFWLSLIVDEPEPHALPNLDYKIVVGNSLVNTFEDEVIDIEWERVKSTSSNKQYVDKIKDLLEQIVKSQKLIFDGENLDKKVLNQEIRNLKIELLTNQLKINQLQYSEKNPKKGGMFPTAKETKFNLEVELELKKFDQLLNKLASLKDNPEKEFRHFDWKLDFPEILNGQIAENLGFNIVIGNPPYLRIQGLREIDNEMANLLSEKYDSATGSFDLYVLFAEKSLLLTKSNGILNFIMPVKWANSAFGKGLREFLNKYKAAKKIISFEAFQVFNASTYTALQWFKKDSEVLEYNQLYKDLPDNKSLEKYLYSLEEHSFNQYPHEHLNESAWTLTDNRTGEILEKIKKQPRKIKDFFEKIFQGIATSKDSVYFIMDSEETEDEITGYSKELDRRITIERGLVKPLLKGDQVHRYEKLFTKNFVIFPYKIIGGKAVLYSEEEIAENFPKGYDYLLENKTILWNRENKRFAGKYWFQFGRNQGVSFGGISKLICPDICLGGNYAFDKKGEFYDTTTLYGYIKHEKEKTSYEYFLGLMNSNLVWYFLKNTGTVLANGYFRFMPRYVNEIPVYIPNQNQEKIITDFVKDIQILKSQNQETKKLESKIDQIVYKLYDLTYEEVKVIDPDFELSEEEYGAIEA